MQRSTKGNKAKWQWAPVTLQAGPLQKSIKHKLPKSEMFSGSIMMAFSDIQIANKIILCRELSVHSIN